MALNLGGLLGRFTSQTASETLGFGVGVALAEALRPEAVDLGQEAWRASPVKALDAIIAAAIVAEAVEQLEWGEGEAAAEGVNADRFEALVGVALDAPGVAELLRMRRRGTIKPDDFLHGLRKSKLETRWDEALAELEGERLDPGELAKAVHRGIVRAAGLLVASPPQTPGRVPIVPQSDLDTLAEFAAWGYDEERARVLVGNAGLPPGIVQMLELVNRGIITEDDFQRGVGESNMRNEWGQAALALRRRLLTPHEYEEAALRGILTRQAADAGAALSGMEAADAALLFEIMGRPLPVRAITTGLARGGQLGGGYADVPEPYRDAIRRSNIRPEYARLAWANRYSLPSAFVLRGMAQSGELTEPEVEQLLLESGWQPELAAKVAQRWAGGAGGAGKHETQAELADEYEGGFLTEAEYRASLTELGYTGTVQDRLVHLGDARRTKRYRDKAIDAVAAAYTSFKVDDTRALAELAELNVAGTAAELLLAVWGKQRLDSIRLLTPTQLKKAYVKGLLTKDEALEALEDEHMTAADAAVFLAE